MPIANCQRSCPGYDGGGAETGEECPAAQMKLRGFEAQRLQVYRLLIGRQLMVRVLGCTRAQMPKARVDGVCHRSTSSDRTTF